MSILTLIKKMINQNQKAGDNSTNIQSAGDVSIGLSYTDTKEMMLDVFKDNFLQLSNIAMETATDRVGELSEKILKRLEEEGSIVFNKAQDPDFQYSLYSIQKEYAKTGDEELGDLLINLLIDKSKQDDRNLLQIVLDEALNVAPKLTKDQLSLLSLMFSVKNTTYTHVRTLDDLGEMFDNYIKPFLDDIKPNESSTSYLVSLGCGEINTTEMALPLQYRIRTGYPGLFMKGFDKEEVKARGIHMSRYSGVFIQCLHDTNNLQLAGINKKDLEGLQDKEEEQKLFKLFDDFQMGNNEAYEVCIKLRPYMTKAFEIWHADIKKFKLSSIGIAIGHANIKKKQESFSDLSIWIN